MARPIRSRAQTSSRSRGASMSGRWGPMALSPGKRWATRNHGTGPTSCRSFILPAVCGSHAAPIPSVRLKAYRRGQQDVEYLTLWSQLTQRAAVGGRPTGAHGLETGRHVARGRDSPAAKMPAASITAGSARGTSGPCGSRSAKPCQRLTRSPGASSSTSARPGANRSD